LEASEDDVVADRIKRGRQVQQDKRRNISIVYGIKDIVQHLQNGSLSRCT
jgi:hypothetical protein